MNRPAKSHALGVCFHSEAPAHMHPCLNLQLYSNIHPLSFSATIYTTDLTHRGQERDVQKHSVIAEPCYERSVRASAIFGRSCKILGGTVNNGRGNSAWVSTSVVL